MTQESELGIIIDDKNIGRLTQKHNLMNMLVHEYKHVLDYRDDKFLEDEKCIIAEKEVKAVEFQKDHPTWEKTTFDFKKFMETYKEENEEIWTSDECE
jgi:hypothetical protein